MNATGFLTKSAIFFSKDCTYFTEKLFITKNVLGIRNASYSKDFIEPIFQREEFEKITETEGKQLAHIPIKAARSEQSSSVFYDPVLEKFINYAMRKGKKELARQQVYKTLETIKRIQLKKFREEIDPEKKNDIELNALSLLHQAIENCKPVLSLTPIKRGGSTYQVPVPLSDKKASFLSMNWLIEQGKAEPSEVRFYIKMANEIISASQFEGKVIRRKQELHRRCEANRAYAHYRWG